MRQQVTAALLLTTGVVGAQQPARHAFTPADWYKVTTLSTPALSPDGKQVAFTVTTVREAENKRHSEVWVVPTQGGQSMFIENTGPKDRRAALPRQLLVRAAESSGKE